MKRLDHSSTFEALEIGGLDPGSDPQSTSRHSDLRAALAKHGVVCLRFDRALEDIELRAIAAMFGPIKDPIARARDGSALRYGKDRQIIDAGFVLTEEMRTRLGNGSFGGDSLRPGLFEFFHTDDSYVDCPAAATVLHARKLPSRGGDTQFIEMRVAYQLLEAALKQSLVDLSAVHAYNNRSAFPPRASATGPLEQMADVCHPIVRAHPVTGEPALYFDLDRATHIEGMPELDGRALLQALQHHAEQRAPRYNHRWRAHDVLVWDNASVQHKASGNFPMGEPRLFWRHLIEGQTPISRGGKALRLS